MNSKKELLTAFYRWPRSKQTNLKIDHYSHMDVVPRSTRNTNSGTEN